MHVLLQVVALSEAMGAYLADKWRGIEVLIVVGFEAVLTREGGIAYITDEGLGPGVHCGMCQQPIGAREGRIAIWAHVAGGLGATPRAVPRALRAGRTINVRWGRQKRRLTQRA